MLIIQLTLYFTLLHNFNNNNEQSIFEKIANHSLDVDVTQIDANGALQLHRIVNRNAECNDCNALMSIMYNNVWD